ncbi:helix-turn-helix domain-containing protein [Methylobacterium tarhaniae]|uniref:helix-turn-helix domain-containing protein n=1 Tax=Methylobacterium tarhaniae TaxID=1187852 RepID=UPI00069D3007|nr:AraC family transcriptional regulator [Methylobacterium tarhaniae]
MDTITLGPTISSPGRRGRGATDEAAFEAYRALYSGGTDVDRAPGILRTEVVAYRLPRMLLFDRRLAGVSHARGPRRVARDGFDHITVHLVLSGSLMLEVPEAKRRVEAGTLALFDLTRPQRTWTEGARIVTAAIARDRLDAATLDGLDLHGLVLGPGEAGLVIDFARSLAAHAGALTPELAAVATDSLCLMLGATLASLRDRTLRAAAPIAAGRAHARAIAYIERHLGDQALTTAAIAAGAGVSRSALYRLFEPAGGVARYVQQQRVTRLRRALSRADDDRTIDELALATGFASPSHAGRQFRTAFGMPPGEYRRSLRAKAESTRIAQGDALRARLDGPLPGLTAWHGELL